MTIDFTYHLLLALLIIPLAMIFQTWLSKGHPVTLPFDNSMAGRGHTLYCSVSLFSCLPAAILAIAILLLAGPTRNGIPKEERQMKNVLFCVDISGSMGQPMGNGKSRYQNAMQAMRQFIDYRKGDSFGLTVFGSEFWHWIPVTEDTQTLNSAEAFLNPSSMPKWMAGGTKIAKALEGCRAELIKKPKGDRMVVLLSDGESQDMRGNTARDLALQLKSEKISIYGVHIGSRSIPASLRTVCEITGGEVFAAADNRALEKTFSMIDSMEKAEFKQSAPLPVDHMQPFAFAGLIFCGFYFISLFGLRFTPW